MHILMATTCLGFLEMLLLISLSFFFYIICHLRLNRSSPIINWPFVGMLPGILHNSGRIHEYMSQLLTQSGSTIMFKGPWFSDMNFLLTCDRRNVHHILSKNFVNYPKGPEFRMIMESLGDGIFNINGESWRIQRKIIHSLIKHKDFESTLEKIIHRKLQKGLLPILEHASKLKLDIDMQDGFQRFSFDIICLSVLGYDPQTLSIDFPQVVYEKAFTVIEEVMIYRHTIPTMIWKLQKWFDIGEEKKMRIAQETFDKFLYGCISWKREKLYKQKIHTSREEQQEYDLLTQLMSEEGILMKEYSEVQMSALKISDKIFKDIVFNLLAAGRDTISAGLTWFIWLVSTHPSIEDKIYEEIQENIQTKTDGREAWLFDAQQLDGLVYLHAALCETLRLYPPVPFNHKTTIQSDILPSGHRVNRNTKTLISFYAMGRTKEIWGEDCFEFKPERWISDRGCIKHFPSYEFTAFNAGPRTCLGKDLSFIEMKMVAVAVLWNYHVQVVEGGTVSPRDAVVLHLKHGLKARFIKRHI